MSPNWTNDDGSCAPCRDEARGGAPCFIHHAKPAPKRRRTTAPSISARLRAAEAVLCALIACDDAISRGEEPPLSRVEVAAAARAALGEP